MSMGSSGGGGGSSSQTQKLDPWLKGQISGNLRDIKGMQFNPYGGQGVANLTPEMQGILGQMQGVGQQGAGLMGQGAEAMQNVAGGGVPELDMAQFQNPYQQQVVDQTMQDMDRARQMAIGQGEDAAIGAGAFGGSRHGIADAETNRAFADRAGAMAGQLNQQGFNTALGAAQNAQGMGLDANRLQMLAGQGLLGAGQGMMGMGQQAAQFGQDHQQAQEDWRYMQHMAPQQFEMDRLGMQTSAIQGIPFMGTTSGSTQQPGGSRLGGGIGGAMSGAGMGGMLSGMSGGAFGGPVGMAVGGGLGLLGGMFG